MELRHLRAFVTVATMGHFGQAAERLNLTQPGLTQRIQSLERELGVQLLERSSREVRLTPAGTLLLPQAQKIIEVEDQALRDLKGYRSGVTGRLRIAYQAAGDVTLVGSIIAEYRRRFPAVEVETTAASSGPNLQRLRDRATDAAVVLMPSAHPPGIGIRSIRREEISLAIRLDHRFAQMDRVPVEALRGEPIGMPPVAVNPDLVAALASWLVRRTGAELNVVSEDPTDLALETVTRSGRAVTLVVPRYLGPTPRPGLAYRSISPAPLVDLAIAYHEDDPLPTLDHLLRIVDEVAPFDPGGVPKDGEPI